MTISDQIAQYQATRRKASLVVCDPLAACMRVDELTIPPVPRDAVVVWDTREIGRLEIGFVE